VSASRARAAIKAAGGGHDGACAVLIHELVALQPALARADLRAVGWLDVRTLAAVIRSAFDPHTCTRAPGAWAGAGPDGAAAGQAGRRTAFGPDLAGPAAAESSWSVYRHDGAWSVSYQVRCWPRSGIVATNLHPLLAAREGARRSFALVCEPLGPRRAERELARARTRRHALVSLRRRTGRLESAEELSDLALADAQDLARARGDGIVRFTALVTVTVTDRSELEPACAQLLSDAAAASLDLRRLYGAQDSGFAAGALPLGRGLPHRRADL
jgi:hypothetical protein